MAVGELANLEVRRDVQLTAYDGGRRWPGYVVVRVEVQLLQLLRRLL